MRNLALAIKARVSPDIAALVRPVLEESIALVESSMLNLNKDTMSDADFLAEYNSLSIQRKTIKQLLQLMEE